MGQTGMLYNQTRKMAASKAHKRKSQLVHKILMKLQQSNSYLACILIVNCNFLVFEVQQSRTMCSPCSFLGKTVWFTEVVY